MKEQKNNLQGKNILCLVFIFEVLSLIINLHPIYADGTSLKITPSTIRIQAQPPADIHAPFSIENQSDASISLKIGYKLFDSPNSQTGAITYLKNGQSIPGQDHQFFSKVQVIDTDNFSHDTIELGPKQKRQLTLRITLPQNQPTTDYYFSLIFLENITQLDQTDTEAVKKQQPSAITLQSGIGLNVFLAVGPKEVPAANIDNYATPFVRQSGPVPFLLGISNIGTHFINPSGTIIIKNIFGQIVGKIVISKSVIPAATSRTFTSTSNPGTASDDQLLAGSTVIWPEKFLLGMYTATINLSLSDEGPITTRTIHFMALPLSFMIGLVLFILLLIIIYVRVKKKITER